MKDNTWSTVRVSPFVALARGMLRSRVETTPCSGFSSFTHFPQLAISEIVYELLEDALVTKRYRHDSEVVIFRKKIISLECADSESACRQNSAVGAQLLTQLVFHGAHTY